MPLDEVSMPKDLVELEAYEKSTDLVHFTADDAWTLGNSIRAKVLKAKVGPVAINIALANSSQLLFHTVTGSGTTPAHDLWVLRKRNTVLRWGCSTMLLRMKMNGDEEVFKARYQLGETARDYAIHGGGVPIRVQGVEGTVAVLVISGLAMEDDHMLGVGTLAEMQETQERIRRERIRDQLLEMME